MCKWPREKPREPEWKKQLLERAAEAFEGPRRKDEPPVDVKALHAKIGQLALENDFLEGALNKPGQEVYLRAYETVSEARTSIARLPTRSARQDRNVCRLCIER